MVLIVHLPLHNVCRFYGAKISYHLIQKKTLYAAQIKFTAH